MSRLNLLRYSWLGPVAAIPIALACFLSVDPVEIFTSWPGFCSQIIIAAAGMVLIYHLKPAEWIENAVAGDDAIIIAKLRIEMLERMIADITAARRALIERAIDDVLSGTAETPKSIDHDDDAI